jgi:hypothetical protein
MGISGRLFYLFCLHPVEEMAGKRNLRLVTCWVFLVADEDLEA